MPTYDDDRSDCGIGMQKRRAKDPLELWSRLVFLHLHPLLQTASPSLDASSLIPSSISSITITIYSIFLFLQKLHPTQFNFII